LAYNASPVGWTDAQAADADTPPCLVDGVDDLHAAWALAIEQAISDSADVISLSMGGELPCTQEMGEAILHAHQAGVIVVTATDNDRGVLLGCPAGANGVISVEIIDVNYELVDPSMEDPYLTILGPGTDIRGLSWSDGAWNRYGTTTGSSVATPFVAGGLALAWSVHRDATANQMIQAMLRNTNGEADHELARNDQYGYGNISVLTMVQSDPTAYPDENPLLHPIGDDVLPLTGDILGTATETTTPEPTDEATTKPTERATTTPDEGNGSNLGLLVGGGALLLVVVVTVVMVVVRRDRTTPGAASTTPTHPTTNPQGGNHP
jgi:subtilisin family serine protease